jgi:hypothetical protein
MEKVEQRSALSPEAFSRQALKALDAADGRTKRRKRDQTPDTIGLAIKRSVLERAAEECPAPFEFEGWLMGEALAEPTGGPTMAMCAQIFEEYLLASMDPAFGRWLAEGAASQDAVAQEG